MKKILKYFFITILIIGFIALIIYLNFLNNRNEESLDVSTQVDKNPKPTVEVSDVFSHNLPKELIYATSSTHLDTSLNLNDLDELYNEMDLIIVGKVSDKGNGVMLEELGYASIPGTLQIDKIIKGSYNEEEITFYTNGGYCTIKEYVDVMSKTQPEKVTRMGFNNISEDEQKNSYLVFNTNYSKDFEENNRYVLMLKKTNDKYICFSNYGMINVNSNENINTFDDIKKFK